MMDGLKEEEKILLISNLIHDIFLEVMDSPHYFIRTSNNPTQVLPAEAALNDVFALLLSSELRVLNKIQSKISLNLACLTYAFVIFRLVKERVDLGKAMKTRMRRRKPLHSLASKEQSMPKYLRPKIRYTIIF